jgi:hypothetical protein
MAGGIGKLVSGKWKAWLKIDTGYNAMCFTSRVLMGEELSITENREINIQCFSVL